MTTATASTLVELGKASLGLARSQTLTLVKDIPADKLLHRTSPNANPALWILAHLAYADSGFLASLSGQDPVLTEDWWKEKFGMGSTPSDNIDDYPSLDEIKAALEKSRAAMIAWFDTLDEAKLLEELPENLRMFAPNLAGILGALAWHEGFHGGQISAIRRSLNLPLTMG